MLLQSFNIPWFFSLFSHFLVTLWHEAATWFKAKQVETLLVYLKPVSSRNVFKFCCCFFVGSWDGAILLCSRHLLIFLVFFFLFSPFSLCFSHFFFYIFLPATCILLGLKINIIAGIQKKIGYIKWWYLAGSVEQSHEITLYILYILDQRTSQHCCLCLYHQLKPNRLKI